MLKLVLTYLFFFFNIESNEVPQRCKSNEARSTVQVVDEIRIFFRSLIIGRLIVRVDRDVEVQFFLGKPKLQTLITVLGTLQALSIYR